MADHFPLLVFPRARTIVPPKGNGFPSSKPHFPGHPRQIERLTPQLDELQQDFSRYKANVSGTVAGLEPETVLVIEIAGRVDDFKQAVEVTNGLEWLGEWDVDDIEPDDDFYEPPKVGVNFFKDKIDGIDYRAKSKEIREILKEHRFIDSDGRIIADKMPELSLPDHLKHIGGDITQAINNAKNKRLKGRLFLSLGNEQGLKELLALWQRWKQEQGLPRGKTKWRDVFDQTLGIRCWGIEETLGETGMINRWRDLLDTIDSAQEIHCQIELFYRQNSEKRQQNEVTITALLKEMGGRTIASFIDMPDIAFHAVKAKLPADQIRRLLGLLALPAHDIDIQLFKFPGIMYFRPTGQSLTTCADDVGEATNFPPAGMPELPPVAAILDGAPNIQHEALKDRLLFDDPDDLAAQYQPGERRHGTSMASLVIHGEQPNNQSDPLTRQVYHLQVMQPNPKARDFGLHEEHFPDEIFFEDRIERAVRRIFEGEGDTPAQAPGIKIINISIGDPERPFIHTPSPWAKLLDWLSWKYRVLFCVSAGNFTGSIDIGMPSSKFSELSDEEKTVHFLKCVEKQLSERRLLSPAESLNSLTVGALHADESGGYASAQRIDLLPSDVLFSPISRFGHGFRRSIKPEILFPGGRQLYTTPILGTDQHYSPDKGLHSPGQQVAWDSAQEGNVSQTAYTRGTSNATALATRSGAKIYDVLSNLQAEHGKQIQDNLMAVLIKALLVHGAQHDSQAKKALTDSLKTKINSRHFKEVMARYVGYGMVDIERVLACTEQQGTVLGCGEIEENQVHEYRFPLPLGLSGSQVWRRMVVTLAWFSPIKSTHRNLREAKLELKPGVSWNKLPLKLERMNSDHNHVLRGTVQHEILEGTSQVFAYEEDGHILLHVTCKADATERLDQAIPYGLAVTLEVAEGVDIPIYEQIRARIKQQVVIGTSVESL